MDLLGIFGAILGVAGAVGAGSAVFYANRSRSIITLLKDENDALGKSNARIEKELELCQVEKRAADDKLKLMTDMVTQAPSIKELTEVMTKQHLEVIKSLGDVATKLSDLAEAMVQSQPVNKRRPRK